MLFDILNSLHPAARGNKKTLNDSNMPEIIDKMNSVKDYLLSLKAVNRPLLYTTKK